MGMVQMKGFTRVWLCTSAMRTHRISQCNQGHCQHMDATHAWGCQHMQLIQVAAKGRGDTSWQDKHDDVTAGQEAVAA